MGTCRSYMIGHVHASETKRMENCCCSSRGQRMKSIFDCIILFKTMIRELLQLCTLSMITVKFQKIKVGVWCYVQLHSENLNTRWCLGFSSRYNILNLFCLSGDSVALQGCDRQEAKINKAKVCKPFRADHPLKCPWQK